MANLFTSHDPYRVHAILGILSLLSFVFSYTTMTVHWGQWALHLSLSCSSLIFTVPARRVSKNPTIIWAEYRLHAIVFSFRSFCIFLCAHQHPAVRLLVVLAASATADFVSSRYGEKDQTTVRGNGKARDVRVKTLIKVYSAYQVLATAAHIAGGTEFNGYTTLIAIQSSAFLMTMVKKGKIKWYYHAALYTLCLGISTVTLNFGRVTTLTLAAFVLARIVFGCNKYFLWTFFTLWVQFWNTTYNVLHTSQ
jgi:hypothetical protein